MGSWDLASVERPWRQGAPSIHGHITKHLSPDGKGLVAGGERLPDEEDDGGLRWGAGGLDGAWGHHGAPGSDRSRAAMLHRAIGVVLEDASAIKLAKLYGQLLAGGAIDFIDPLLERIAARHDLDAKRLEELAVWLAINAPDREPVKFAIALLGAITGADHSALFLTLGRHEELTLYAAVALSKRAGPDAEHTLFELAQHVDGWGRIQIVERLAQTSNEAIKAWMLRDGYKNTVMYEYLAYTCASAGGLRREFENDRVDAALLAGAGDLIEALLMGGPARDIDDYADGAVVVERYVHHLGAAPAEIGQLLVLRMIRGFLDEVGDRGGREVRGWTRALRAALQAKLVALMDLPRWQDIVDAGLASAERLTFHVAARGAEVFGIDTWDHHFARLESGVDDGWYFVMQTGDSARVDRVIALAEQVIPLDEISTGPAEEMGRGRAWASHGHLDFVLQGLRRWPGKGWSLIRAGLRSPVVRVRHMALAALSPWGKGCWPADAEGLLQATLTEEPVAEVRAALEALLAGRQLEAPERDAEQP